MYENVAQSTKIYAINLRYALKLRGMTQLELAKEIDSVKQSVNGWFQAYRMPNPEYMDKIAEVLRPPVSAFFDEDGRCGLNRPVEVSIPSISETGVVSLAKERISNITIDAALRGAVNQTSSFSFTVPDNAMAPKFQEGDLLVCRHATRASNGQYVVALINGKTAVRQYHASKDGALVFFVANNPKDDSDTDMWSENDPNKPTIVGIPFSLQRKV